MRHALHRLVILVALVAGPAAAQNREVPYWATLRAAEVNMRVGPSEAFPIEWVYRRAGLPLGPIANPGRESIAAVLDPELHGYIYFVADGTGGHIFARTYAEHRANVEKWFAIRRARGEM